MRAGIILILVIATVGISFFSNAGESEKTSIALWPAVVGILSAFLLRNALAGLFLGALSGALMIQQGNFLNLLPELTTKHLIPSLSSDWNLCVILFTLFMGSFIALLQVGGGLQSLMESLLPNKGKNQSSKVEWSAYAMGGICFFDGLANSMLVGRVLTPFAQTIKSIPARLAYIVDSTSSPIACIAPISTWIAYQLTLIQKSIDETQAPLSAYGVFLESIPLNFYCLFTLICVALVIYFQWNLGPMKESPVFIDESDDSPARFHNDKSSHWIVAMVPLLSLIIFVFAGMLWDGTSRSSELNSIRKALSSSTNITLALGSAHPAYVLFYSSLLACAVAIMMNLSVGKRGSNDSPSSITSMIVGAQGMFQPVLILVAAWTLASTLKVLGAATVIGNWVVGMEVMAFIPVTVFIIGALISFSTGTSWGTMAVLMPLILPEAMEPSVLETTPWMPAAVTAAVFSGAVFGDHCSPVSDTTLVSALACDVDPMEHVRTQLPYALLTGGLAALVGFIPVGLGAPAWLCILLGTGTLFTLAWKFSLAPESGPEPKPE